MSDRVCYVKAFADDQCEYPLKDDIDLDSGGSGLPRPWMAPSVDPTAARALARPGRRLSASRSWIRALHWGGHLESESLEDVICDESCQSHESALRHQSDAVRIVRADCWGR